MRGQTILFKVNGQQVRRSTKHVKIGRRCVPNAKKWDMLLSVAYGKRQEGRKV